jgi:hypothetical protein
MNENDINYDALADELLTAKFSKNPCVTCQMGTPYCACDSARAYRAQFEKYMQAGMKDLVSLRISMITCDDGINEIDEKIIGYQQRKKGMEEARNRFLNEFILKKKELHSR